MLLLNGAGLTLMVGDAGENGVALAASAQEQVREEVARVRAELEADNAYARGRLDSMQVGAAAKLVRPGASRRALMVTSAAMCIT